MQTSGLPNLKTLEIRWFFREDCHSLRSGFGRLPSEQLTRESRTDNYLRLPGRDDLGIKIRQGRLEIKYRICGPRAVEATPGIRGVQEGWEKLGFELTPDGIPRNLPGDFEAAWVKVAKQRLVTTVHLADGQWHFQPPQQSIPGAVQVEYTRIRLEGMQWYTFGVEWPHGDPPDLALAVVKEWGPPEGLKEGDSMGYPTFIRRLSERHA